MVLADPVLVGRTKELSQLKCFLENTKVGMGATVFVSGEAGSGKTRLANEFLDFVRSKKVTVLTGWCLSNAAVPYFPFIEAFESYLSENEEKSRGFAFQQFASKSLLIGPKHAMSNQKIEANTVESWKDQAFASVAKDLLNLSNNEPLVLFIDDLQWADSASLALIHYLSRLVKAEKILILSTFRREELNSTAEGQPNALAETLRLMGREDLFSKIDLVSLNESEVVEIAESVLLGSLHSRFAQKLAKESQGSPLFVVESLRMLHEQHGLVQEADGKWSVDVDKFRIPTRVKDIILRRLSTLRPDQRRILDVASVIGEKFNVDLIGAVLEIDGLRVLEVLNSIAHSNSLVCCEGNVFRFDHSKSRDVLYEEIFPPLRQGYHTRVAEKIEANILSFAVPPVGDLAYHFAKAGNSGKAVKYALIAGHDALLRFSNVEAINHFSNVLKIVSDTDQFAKEKIIAFEGLGDALFANGMFEEAIVTYEKVFKYEFGVVSLRTFRKAVSAAFWDSKPAIIARFAGIGSKVAQYAPFDSLEAARLSMLRANNLAWDKENLEQAIEWIEKSLRVFENEYSLSDVADALFQVGYIYAVDKQIEKALDASQRSIALYRDLGDVRGQMRASCWAAIVFGHHCGFVQEALEKYAVAKEIAEKVGDYITLAWVGLYEGALLESVGEFGAAISTSLRGLECAEKTSASNIHRMDRANLTRQYTKLGELDNARRYYESLIKDFPNKDNSPAAGSQGIAVANWTKAVFLSGNSQWKEANECFESCLNLLSTTFERVPLEAWFRTDYALALERQGRYEDSKVQSEEAHKLAVAYDEIGKKFAKSNVNLSLLVSKEVKAGEPFEIRLELANVGKDSCVIAKVNGLIRPGFGVASIPSFCTVQKDTLLFNELQLGAFEAESIKLCLVANKPGIYDLDLRAVFYESEKVRTITTSPKPFRIEIKPAAVETGKTETKVAESVLPAEISKEAANKDSPKVISDSSNIVEFSSEMSQKAFEYLLNSFAQDYMRKRLSLENSGWRTLTEIIKRGSVHKFSVYGDSYHRGQALAELERRGLIEVRTFLRERGRGGKIMRARICYDKEPIKRLVDQSILKRK